MKRDHKFWGRDDPPPTESSGELERVPRAAGTGTAVQQIHLRITMERKAAEALRGVLERDRKRVVTRHSRDELLSTLCVDAAWLDLQSFTGTVRICSCEAFDEL